MNASFPLQDSLPAIANHVTDWLLWPILSITSAVSEIFYSLVQTVAATDMSRIGGNLVEISAVSTIIGAPIAEALIHGLKAACALVWAPMSCFGQIHVIKACLSASVPDSLRESMGLRNQFVDNALGVILPVNRFRRARSRIDFGDAGAIEIVPCRRWIGRWALTWAGNTNGWPDVAPLLSLQQWKRRSGMMTAHEAAQMDAIARIKASESHEDVYTAHVIYTMDKNAQLALDTVPAAEKGSPIDIYRFIPDQGGLPSPWRDWICLFLSLVKLIEVFALRKVGSRGVWAWTMAGWAHAFVAAVLLQVTGLGRDSPSKRTRHLVAGILPSPLRMGEQGKIVLGIPANIRRHTLWRIVLGVGIGVNLAGLLGTFIHLDNEPTEALYFWIGFQVLWLVMRTIVYYFAAGGTAIQQGIMSCRRWNEAPPEDRQQVLSLLNELASHQASTHPRGFHAYLFDCMSFDQLGRLFVRVDWTLTPRLPPFPAEIRLDSMAVHAVTGDPMIRSAVWQQGVALDNSELYDACIAFVNLASGDKQGYLMVVPCVRVYSCHCGSKDGHDRGNSHPDCGRIEWWHFFPVDIQNSVGGYWLVAHGKQGVGQLEAEILDEDELDRRLFMGWWKISITGIRVLRKTWEVSVQAAEITLSFTRGMTE
ncbi:uncharacterized protein CDV56_103754 [Aspergillus thermomutatus]|uniref:Uncharacterized protein n=1 Tax=Aspergillus thermomutatus TaxID=41047 RepID=A0A397GA70_ASPTH|nr:uncharacterized protein CDV56_103754 [Aspergillus thermomutatus]RHZ46498.1 hypothetical protein CDV56_103754 [Aspergillus thermomutatus]